MGIADYSSNPDANTAISGIDISEGCAASGINNAIRQLMADLASPYFALQVTAVSVSCGGASDVALTPTQGAANILKLVGSPSAAKNIVFPQVSGVWFVVNTTAGSKQLTMKMPTGGTVVAPVTGNFVLLSDGTNMILAETGVVTQSPGNNTSAPASTAFTTQAVAAEAAARAAADTFIGTDVNGIAQQLADRLTSNAVGSNFLFQGTATYTLGQMVAGPQIGRATGTTWCALGSATIASGNVATLFVRAT